MRYIGSKANLLENIKQVMDSYCGVGNKSFCDMFSGTGTVSRFFKPYYFLDEANRKNICFALSNVFKHKDKENKLLIEWAKKYKINYINNDYSNCNYQLKERKAETIEVLITNFYLTSNAHKQTNTRRQP